MFFKVTFFIITILFIFTFTFTFHLAGAVWMCYAEDKINIHVLDFLCFFICRCLLITLFGARFGICVSVNVWLVLSKPI